jgi:hypothetical protein
LKFSALTAGTPFTANVREYYAVYAGAFDLTTRTLTNGGFSVVIVPTNTVIVSAHSGTTLVSATNALSATAEKLWLTLDMRTNGVFNLWARVGVFSAIMPNDWTLTTSITNVIPSSVIPATGIPLTATHGVNGINTNGNYKPYLQNIKLWSY